jgi:hypothetical protein
MDLFEGRELRDEGISQVLSHNENWLERCVEIASQYAVRTPRFTGEDIRLYCTAIAGYPKHPNAWGGLVNALIKRGVIEETGEYTPMRDPNSHARRTAVYRGT